jgi:tetratricopeptide (TPR) repeat protein
MTEPWLADLRGEFQDIDGRIGNAGDPAHRESVKREIIALFKRVDGALTELGQLKEDIKGLVERYKQAGTAPETAPASPAPAPAPLFTDAKPVVHADHLGASTFIEKGWSLISLGDYAGAIQSLDKALALSPGAVQAQSLLGWAQMLHEDYDDALATFSKVLMKEPANALARINVGYICLKKRIFGEAIEHLSKAIRLDNDRKATLYAHYYLGLVYQEREMFEDAQTFFRKTLKLGPNLIEAYFELGRAQWFSGDKTGARKSWDEGHKANKFNPWAKRCKEMLDLVAAGGEVPRSLLS